MRVGIFAKSPEPRHIEIIVVSDGSTDRTVEISQSYDDVKVIVFEKNRGYGAAIKEGFRSGSGTLMGFLDADGTCDPLFFAEMCRSRHRPRIRPGLRIPVWPREQDAVHPQSRQ